MNLAIPKDHFIPEDIIHAFLYRAHTLRNGASELVEALQKKGLRTLILSNHFPDSTRTPPDQKRQFPTMKRFTPNNTQRRWIQEHFGARTFQPGDIIFSNAQGVAKPNRRIFHIAQRQAELQPDEIAFVDDQAVNTNSAMACGYLTSHFVAAARQNLQDDFLLNELATGKWRQEAFKALQETPHDAQFDLLIAKSFPFEIAI